MTTTITYNGKQFIEQDNTNIQLTNVKCKCGNELNNIPLAVWVLGITDSCGHCDTTYGYAGEQHCDALRESYISLIESEELVEL